MWPEYGSYIKIELLQLVRNVQERNEDEKADGTNNSSVEEYVVRFSLNDKLLRPRWSTSNGDGDDDDCSIVSDTIPLHELARYVQTVGAA